MSDGSLVLVIDDDESVRKALSRLIQSVGLDVETFPSAQAFLAEDLPEGASCLVLDVRMPGLSGLDLLEELRQAGVETPVIFITGHGEVPLSVRAMKAGAVDFLEKPFNDQQLLDAIHQAIASDEPVRRERAARAEVQRRFETLTHREREVLVLVVTGLLNKEIGAELRVSEKTIKVHRARVMEKMEANSLPHLVRMAQKAKIPIPDDA